MTTHSLTPVRVEQRLRREEGASPRERELGKGKKTTHESVMVKEAIELLDLKRLDMVVDCTLGLGGHTEAILRAAPVTVLGLDADPAALAAARERLAQYHKRAELVEANFGDLEAVLKKQKIPLANKFLFDLGWNMTQMSSGRGFTFMHDEPLVMSYGERPASGFTAAEILNTWKENVLADVIFGYGEERYARPIAKAIVARREIAPIATTLELVEIVRDAVPARYRHGRLNPATKTFQALRIAVNDELGVIDRGIRAAWKHLAPGGRIVVITFHSIEDRAVKRLFAELAKEHTGKLVIKKPLAATREEVMKNPSARSAKVRAIEKLAAK
ncbi:MAG TPA: 16S rRNA (cytosine(1402)-N(4))-methyltransferase RsmH [Candidatus Paceibacterota bacterium]|nr:16S rRNA (cytosine(1402)-N(4))-methyltransferase RsmH [Candidatus Paceibacterota bacterium]